MDQRTELQALATSARARIERMRSDRQAIVEMVASENVDDEHDPDGATLAWEREQLAALIAEEERTLASVADALERLDEGTYGVCEGCSEPIPAARLAARPHARRCVPCAST